MKHFQTIANFQYASEYSVLKLLFDQEEIRYVFLNETMMGIFPFYYNGIGGIRLQVYKEDIPKALEIIENFNNPSNLKIV